MKNTFLLFGQAFTAETRNCLTQYLLYITVLMMRLFLRSKQMYIDLQQSLPHKVAEEETILLINP